MTKYLISFPSEAMVLTKEEFPQVAAAARAVIAEAKAAGVYVFGGGIDEQVDPVMVSVDGEVSSELYPGSRLRGGFTVLELPTRDDALEWARKSQKPAGVHRSYAHSCMIRQADAMRSCSGQLRQGTRIAVLSVSLRARRTEGDDLQGGINRCAASGDGVDAALP